jgi:hypothetical protein
VVKKNVLVAAGAVGTAIVSEVQRPKAFGKAGKMEVQVQSVQAVDGQQILIRGIPMTYEGEHRKGLAWGVAIGAGFFTGGLGVAVGFLFKGKDAELRAGTTISSTVASDSEVEIE